MWIIEFEDKFLSALSGICPSCQPDWRLPLFQIRARLTMSPDTFSFWGIDDDKYIYVLGQKQSQLRRKIPPSHNIFKS